MKTPRITLVALGAMLALGSLSALAGNTTLFSSRSGDIVFPISPPTNAGATPGAIDNMSIGATTPAPAKFTTLTSPAVAGVAAAQGGPVAITGGTSSTSANAGGAVNVTGGTPGATGVGGAVALAAGAGGSTSGAGGVASLRGGAGTTLGDGGIAAVLGGAGAGSGSNGGQATLTGGASGSSGTGGSVSINGGASSSGVGGSVSIAAGASAGGTNNGASVDLVPGGAVSTGIPGKVSVNGDANLMCGSYYFTGTPAATSQVFYIANRPMIVTSISEVHSAAAGGTSTLDVTKDTGTGAPASGSALGQAAFDLNGTANTVQNASLNATVATIRLAAGNRLAVKFNHAIQSSAGVVVTACMAPL